MLYRPLELYIALEPYRLQPYRSYKLEFNRPIEPYSQQNLIEQDFILVEPNKPIQPYILIEPII